MVPTQRQHLTLLLLLSCCCTFFPAPIECRSRDKENRRRPGANGERLASASSSSSSSAALAPSSSSSYASASSSYSSTPTDTSSYYGSGSAASAGSYGRSGASGDRMNGTDFCARHRNMKLMCYCTPADKFPVHAAECWVLTDGLLEDDPAWTRFYQQRRLRDLKFLVQSHGHLDYIPTMVIETLKNLTSITIDYAQIGAVPSYAFANLTQLDRIILTNNHILALRADAFANHVRLRVLNLEQNQISDIEHYAFRNLPKCEELYLNENNITSLHEGLFVSLLQLQHLNLAYNQISVLTSEVFKGLGNLKVLNLTHNNINFIGDTVFAELWVLTELYLNDNSIERISERALDGLNTLKTLNLRNNLLKKIDNGLLHGTPALMSINVQRNQLETLTYYTFKPIMDTLVNSTSELVLSGNNFICDCRLNWIFDLRRDTHHQPLRDALEDIICTLQEPKLSNFVEPVPSHILDLLNVGRYAANGDVNNNRNRLSKSRKMKMRSQSQSQSQSQAELVAFAHDGDEASQRLQRRALPNVEHQPVVDETAYKYFDDVAQQVGDEILDDFDHSRQHNDLYHPPAGGAIDSADNSALPKLPLGFKVRLFMLQQKELPCHEEIAHPTELPLSRDLVDLRSNPLNGAPVLRRRNASAACWAIVAAACLTFGQRWLRRME